MLENNITIYEDPLKTSGFNESLHYVDEELNDANGEKKQKRKRKIIWFNPPYSMDVKSNVGETFFETFTETFSTVSIFFRITECLP